MDGISRFDEDATATGPFDPIFAGRERRRPARALSYWSGLRGARALPLLKDLDPKALAAFAPYSLLIDLPTGPPGPSIAYVGAALREEALVASETPQLGDIPDGSLLAELLRHYPRIVAHRAPVEFQAEFVGRGGAATHYRGILLPFARDEAGRDGGARIAAVYGVISWEIMADAKRAPDVAAAVHSAAGEPAPAILSPWGAVHGELPAPLPPQSFDARVAQARTWAALAAAERTHRTASLHAALGAAHDLHRSEPGCNADTIVALVFGDSAGRRDRARYAAVLDHAARLGIGPGLLPALLDRQPHGVRSLAAAERRACRGEARGHRGIAPIPTASGHIALAPINADFLLMLGRRAPGAVTPRPIAPRRAAG